MTINGIDDKQVTEFFRTLAESTGVSSKDIAECLKRVAEDISSHVPSFEDCDE